MRTAARPTTSPGVSGQLMEALCSLRSCTHHNQNEFPRDVSSLLWTEALNLLGPKVRPKHAIRQGERGREAAVTATSDRSNHRAVSSRLIKLPLVTLDEAKFVTLLIPSFSALKHQMDSSTMAVPWSTALLRMDVFVDEFAPFLGLPLKIFRTFSPFITIAGLGVVVWWRGRRDEGEMRRRVEVSVEMVCCRGFTAGGFTH